jgi:hypothetical protein
MPDATGDELRPASTDRGAIEIKSEAVVRNKI